eukprot:757309-Hanusia_phi.AAC.1
MSRSRWLMQNLRCFLVTSRGRQPRLALTHFISAHDRVLQFGLDKDGCIKFSHDGLKPRAMSRRAFCFVTRFILS